MRGRENKLSNCNILALQQHKQIFANGRQKGPSTDAISFGGSRSKGTARHVYNFFFFGGGL